MAMLLQQFRRSAFSRRGTAAALTPSVPAFSRFSSTSIWGPGPQNESTGALVLQASKYLFMYGFIYKSFYWLDYGGRRTEAKEWEKLDAEHEKEWLAYLKVKKEFENSSSRE